MTSRLADFYPTDYQAWLFAALDLTPGGETEAAMLEPLFALNHTWVGGAAPAVAYADDAAAMRAYTCYYMTINLPKLWFMLARCHQLLLRWPNDRPLRVADLGCGPGTMTWALLFYLQRARPELIRHLELQGIDRGTAAIACAQRLAAGLTRWPLLADLKMTWTTNDWTTAVPDADLILCGNTLVESGAAALQALQPAANRLVVVVEPGTREAFRLLLPWRDQMLAADWRIAFPCTSANRCPMAADNWCHFFVNRFELPFIQRMSNRAGRRNHRHNFCGFVFAAEATPGQPAWRVLSSVRKVHRSAIRYLCDGRKMREFVLNRREKGEGNRPFVEAEVGDAIVIETAAADNVPAATGRLRATDSVRPLP